MAIGPIIVGGGITIGGILIIHKMRDTFAAEANQLWNNYTGTGETGHNDAGDAFRHA
jgi:hypothetical protein